MVDVYIVINFYVYIIKSISKEWYYVGFTKNIEARLLQHNNGEVKSTKSYKPFQLIFVQVVGNSQEARSLEKFLKVNWNKESLLEIINAGVVEW